MSLRVLLFPVLFLALPVFAGPTVYMPLGSGNAVIAIDGASDKITATYPGVENSHGLVTDGEYVIAGSFKEEQGKSPLYLVHPVHGHVMLTIPVEGSVHHLAITPDGRYLLSTHPTRGGISVVDLNSNQIVRTVKTGPAPNYALATKDGAKAYVSNSGNGTISEIDIATWKVLRQLKAGAAPEHMVFSHDEKIIYVTNPRAGTVSAVSVAGGKVTQAYNIGPGTHGLDLSDDKKRLFATSQGENKLVAIDLETGASRSIKLSPEPYHMGAVTGAGKLYVSSRKAPKLWVIDQTNLSVLGEITLPKGEGHQMAVVR